MDASDQEHKIKILLALKPTNDFGCLVWTIPLICLAVWSRANEAYFLVLASASLVLFVIYTVYNDFVQAKEFSKWMSAHNGTIVFFYPTNKNIQSRIENKICGYISDEIVQMSYTGPKITGGIKNQHFIKWGLNQINKSEPNHPRLIQLDKLNVIELKDLKVLMNIETLEDVQIESIISQINDCVEHD